MEDQTPHDVRLVYLALAHILKTRGHFLYSDSGVFKLGDQYANVFNNLILLLDEVLEIHIPETLAQQWHEILTDRSTKNLEKQTQLLITLDRKDPQIKNLAKLLTGYEAKFIDLFGEQYKEAGTTKVKLSKVEEDTLDQLRSTLEDDHFELILAASAFYNLVRLETLLQGADSLSQTKINIYEKHGKDLKRLKSVFRKYVSQEEYHNFFSKSAKGLDNYVAYSGYHTVKKVKHPVLQKCNQESFLDYLKKTISRFPQEIQANNDVVEILNEVEKGTFLPKITDKDNSLIPHQLHHAELQLILRNASTYLPFLNEIGSDGFTKAQMISLISDFRIPYYVGPLNPAHSIKSPNSAPTTRGSQNL